MNQSTEYINAAERMIMDSYFNKPSRVRSNKAEFIATGISTIYGS
jgi:hypothetical protein